jgi:hypothetical protein
MNIGDFCRITLILTNYSQVPIAKPFGALDLFSAEYGGQLPLAMVEELKRYGADVLEYKHHGTISTVVQFGGLEE